MRAILDQAWGPRDVPDEGVSRQGRRRKMRLEAFREMTGKFGGEARKVRRGMARERARREWRDGMNSVENPQEA